jgi:hypothetical protein
MPEEQQSDFFTQAIFSGIGRQANLLINKDFLKITSAGAKIAFVIIDNHLGH